MGGSRPSLGCPGDLPVTALILQNGIYLGLLALLGLYGLHRLVMLARFRWVGAKALDGEPGDDHPLITIQLPIYNERTVAARLLRAVGALDWPRERLEIQVLDDSSDETREIVDRELEALRESGLDARVLRREERRSFKAGALACGLERARGQLLCVFDADFVPPPDFLRRMTPHFLDPEVGMVQARWGHANREESFLTRAQSTLLDGHFVIEHGVRYRCGLFFNFNGTAGIWRREAIVDAGGWEGDTLTEDLDLSYRAQLAGWRFVYASQVVAAAEVPPDIAAFKSQQHRWARGSVQVTRKLGRRILTAGVPSRIKLEALAHLTSNSGYPLVLALAVLLPLSLGGWGELAAWVHLALFLVCTVSVFAFYDASQRALGRGIWQRLRDVPAAVALGIGMSLSQTRAVLLGLRGESGSFVRTPKRGEECAGRPYRSRLRGLPGSELLLAGWLAWAMASAVARGHWGALPFLALFLWGFAWVGLLSLREWSLARRGGA